MTALYDAVNAIYGRGVSGEVTALGEVVEVLAAAHIRPRQDDGILRQINLSLSPARRDVIVVGFRYEKRDATPTEDHFVFRLRSPTTVEKYYGKRLEEVFPEYEGTHKQRADFGSTPDYGVTFPNTITFNLPRK